MLIPSATTLSIFIRLSSEEDLVSREAIKISAASSMISSWKAGFANGPAEDGEGGLDLSIRPHHFSKSLKPILRALTCPLILASGLSFCQMDTSGVMSSAGNVAYRAD